MRHYSRMRQQWEYASRRSRGGFALTSAVVAISLLGDALLYALLPARPGHFEVRVWQVGILLGANRIVRLLTNELAGRLVAVRGGRGPLAWAVVLGSAVTASYALPLGFWGLLAGRVLWGACWSVLRVEGYLSALAVSNSSTRGRIFGLYQAATRLGQGGGALIGGLLADLIGIPRVFVLFGLCTFLGLPLVLALPRSAPPPARATAGSEAMPAAPMPAEPTAAAPVPAAPTLARCRDGEGTLQPALLARLRRQPLALWAAALALPMVEQIGANLVGRLAADRIGPALAAQGGAIGVASLTGLLLSFRSIGSLGLSPVAGWLGDRLGRQPLLFALIGLQLGTFAALALLRPWALLVGTLLLQLACGTSAYLLIHTLAGDRLPVANTALHLSRFTTFVDVGTALGPMAAFALYARFGFSAVAVLAWLLLAAAAGAVSALGPAAAAQSGPGWPRRRASAGRGNLTGRSG